MVVTWLWVVLGLLVVGLAAGWGVAARRRGRGPAPAVRYRARRVGGVAGEAERLESTRRADRPGSEVRQPGPEPALSPVAEIQGVPHLQPRRPSRLARELAERERRAGP